MPGKVDARGVFAWPVGPLTIPGAANPISGREIVMDSTSLDGRFAPGKFCSQLAGHVLQPVELDLAGTSNTCVFVRANEGDPLPALTSADFAAGCPL